ncbi:MAG: DUF3489 domain-containing protein [Phenylobacterium sp.]|uniref:DUF3489 domain-containing protein n=1 Tax=Phenylobacterium sp. TaxID=1871053 RepID=UPI002733BEB8|nr:DUF3489 domain-containing protein [Phenylobacterium sp.]MDP3173735.1 DUF3489 domain-containing protein [Phenylobacterium sp.]
MAKQPGRGRAKAAAPIEDPTIVEPAPERRVTRTDALIALMRTNGGATAADLAAAVGWQVHSIRGLIAGTLKKRSDLTLTAVRSNGVTRYSVTDAAGPEG